LSCRQQGLIRPELLPKQLRCDPFQAIRFEMNLEPVRFVPVLIPPQSMTGRHPAVWNVAQVRTDHFQRSVLCDLHFDQYARADKRPHRSTRNTISSDADLALSFRVAPSSSPLAFPLDTT